MLSIIISFSLYLLLLLLLLLVTPRNNSFSLLTNICSMFSCVMFEVGDVCKDVDVILAVVKDISVCKVGAGEMYVFVFFFSRFLPIDLVLVLLRVLLVLVLPLLVRLSFPLSLPVPVLLLVVLILEDMMLLQAFPAERHSSKAASASAKNAFKLSGTYSSFSSILMLMLVLMSIPIRSVKPSPTEVRLCEEMSSSDHVMMMNSCDGCD
mmetsp:Transcript_10957/g.13856  ORF Transcript_10957/g.13856 Transcript_10957/m.13856 type:complete len:208 (-) Transcript_10957:248-871(-)